MDREIKEVAQSFFVLHSFSDIAVNSIAGCLGDRVSDAVWIQTALATGYLMQSGFKLPWRPGI
jgi:hypothetical protein